MSLSVNLTASGNDSVTDTETVGETIIDATDATGEAEASDESQYEETAQTLCPEAIFGKADVSGLNRLTYKEDLNTLVYANADGTETMYIFGGNIKYIDSEGKVKDKSTRLVSSKDGFVNVDNDIRVSFSEEASGGAKLAYDDIEIVLIPSSVSKDIGKATLSMGGDGGARRQMRLYAPDCCF